MFRSVAVPEAGPTGDRSSQRSDCSDGQQAGKNRLGSVVERRSVPTLRCCQSRDIIGPLLTGNVHQLSLPRSAWEQKTTTEQSQRRASTLQPKMACNGRPTYQERYVRNSSWPGVLGSTKKAEYIAQTASRPIFSLAVVRRTIHFRPQGKLSHLRRPPEVPRTDQRCARRV